MGHSVDIFPSPPPDSCICAVCTDVLKDAVAFKCGHTYCNECATACLRSRKCPTCRGSVSSSIPIFTLRNMIGAMEVKCPNGKKDIGEDPSTKRARGNEGEVVHVVSSVDGCGWSGKCQDLQSHEDVCDFKVVKCSIDGCNHECQRKNMNNHLSGIGFLHHMNLMKQSITASYEKKIDSMEKKIKSMQKEISDLKAKQNHANQLSDNDDRVKTIVIAGCGTEDINGVYKQSGQIENAPIYSKHGLRNDVEVAFTLYRANNTWYISILDEEGDAIFFYFSVRENGPRLPPTDVWSVFAGEHPPPRITLQED